MYSRVERWDIFELALKGQQEGNPFVDVRLSAQFRYKNRVVEVDGFYDGNGIYRIRFMPDKVGAWTCTTSSNVRDLDGVSGEFVCTEPALGNHGPVKVRNGYHFAYADGTAYCPVGTTCYAWIHQGDELETQTLATLKASPFNKLRMCVFPKHMPYNRNEPSYHPFQLHDTGGWNFARFDPEFFRHLEQRVGDLLRLGVEADVILFHPYDRWGYAAMDRDADERYLRYIVARLSAFRNVWWSMANEYDLMTKKDAADWDCFFRIVQENDPYQRLRSIHNCREFYDHGKPWVTHASVQSSELDRVSEWRQTYRKPVVVDECRYEGNVEQRWGNISAQELVHRFWLGTIRGGYVGHGETYRHPEDILWWSKGGVLHGQSPARIAFLRSILEEGPGGLERIDQWSAGKEGEYYLFYFGVHQPGIWTFDLPAGREYQVELIDPWEMTIAPINGAFEGKFQVELPGKPYQGARIQVASSG
jgi:hypothetical protein